MLAGPLTLKAVLYALRGVCHKWWDIAIQLERSEDELTATYEEQQHDDGKCFKVILSDWLKTDNPTWSAIAAVLRAPTVGFERLANKIEEKYTNTNGIERVNSHDTDGVNEVMVVSSQNIVDAKFHCPCKKCSLESYLDEGCPNSNSKLFPYLKLDDVDEDSKKNLMHKLSTQSAEMIKEFSELFDKTCASLSKREINVESLAVRVLGLGAYRSSLIHKPLMHEAEMELKTAKSIESAFLVLRPYMSFFNFELLEHIIESEMLCSDDDRIRMKEYRSKFERYCKRKVFEVPYDAIGQITSNLKTPKKETFAVLITDDEKDLIDVKKAEGKFATLLNVRPSTLYLHKIDVGCLLLVFSVPEFVAQNLFPLDPSFAAILREEGYTVFGMLYAW